MFAKKFTLLILTLLFSSFSLVEIVAQKDNKIGIGYNLSFTEGYYWLKDNSNRSYSYDENARPNYVNFKEEVWGISYIAGIDNIWNYFNLEIKYILLSVEQFERYSSDDHLLAPSTSRWQKINLNTLRLSLSYYFNF